MNEIERDKIITKTVFVSLIILTVIIPFIIFAVVFYIGEAPVYEKKDVLSYYGSIVGACFGGFITAAGLYFTLHQNSKTFQKQLTESKTSQEENKYDSVMPMLKMDKGINELGRLCLYNDCVPLSTETQPYIDILIKNIGTGPAMKIKIQMDNSYLKTSKKNVNELDLGVNETSNIRIFLKKDHILRELNQENYYSNFILECHNIYVRRRYIFNIDAIINKNSKSIDLLSYKGLQIDNI